MGFTHLQNIYHEMSCSDDKGLYLMGLIKDTEKELRWYKKIAELVLEGKEYEEIEAIVGHNIRDWKE